MFSTIFKCKIFIFTLICQAFCYEPTEKDLKCFNDYDTEMKCSLHLRSCSGYKLNITHTGNDVFQKMYACVFESNCECKIEVGGFVLTETFNITLLKGANVLLSKTLQTEEFIKPKTPDLSVQDTENGNFIVTWDSHYEIGLYIANSFLDDLNIHLTYGIEGGLESISETEENIAGSYVIVSQNLQPNTNYILTATMSTSYNADSIYSDQSRPVYFTTPSSPNEMAKMIIALLCLAVIITICTMFFFILRLKTNWWDKISKPKIDASLGVEKGYILPPSGMKISPIHVDVPTLDLKEDENLISALSADTNNEKSFHSFESMPGDYGLARPSSPEENISTNITTLVHEALDALELFKVPPVTNMLLPSSDYSPVNTSGSYKSGNGFGSSIECKRANRDSGNCSGSSVFSNRSYLGTLGDSSFRQQLNSNDECQSSKRKGSEDSQFNSPTNDTLEDGYQSFNSVSGKGNDADVCVTLSDDVGADEKCIIQNLITSPNPLYPSLILHDASDEGYQAFQDSTKSTERQWSASISTEQALNACGALKFPQSTGQDPTSVQQNCWDTLHPIIQMDSSYQCV